MSERERVGNATASSKARVKCSRDRRWAVERGGEDGENVAGKSEATGVGREQLNGARKRGTLGAVGDEW